MFHKFCRMLCSCLLKSWIVHVGAVICFVGDCPNNDKWNVIQPGCVSDGCALHFGTETSREVSQNIVFDRRTGDKLISGNDPALKYFDIRINCFAGRFGKGNHLRICLERERPELRNLSDGIAETGGVHIVLERIPLLADKQ